MKNRMYHRINLKQPMHARLQIVEYRGETLSSPKYAPVKILNLGFGGLCFVTTLDFPCDPDFLVKVTFNQEIVTGHIVWQQRKIGYYMYGLKKTSSTISFFQLTHGFKETGAGY